MGVSTLAKLFASTAINITNVKDPQNVLEKILEHIPENVPENAPENVPENVPENAPKCTLERDIIIQIIAASQWGWADLAAG